MNRKAFHRFLILLAALLTVSCTAHQVQRAEKPDTVTPTPKVDKGKPVARQSVKKSKVKAEKPVFNRKTVNLYLEGGDYRSALEVVEQERARGVPEKDLTGEYLKSLNGAIEKAQSLLAENDPGQAGQMFRVALDAYPVEAGLVQETGLQSAELEAALKLCADKLMERGLVAYRAGNLGQAIQIWKEALTFYPDHQASKKAIETTHAQLANLEKLVTEE